MHINHYLVITINDASFSLKSILFDTDEQDNVYSNQHDTFIHRGAYISMYNQDQIY